MQLSWVHEGVRDGSGGRETGLVPIPSFVGHKLKMRLIASRNGSNYSYSECSGDDRCHCCSLSASKDSLETSILDPRHFATHHKRHLQSAHSTQGCLLKLFAFFALKAAPEVSTRWYSPCFSHPESDQSRKLCFITESLF